MSLTATEHVILNTLLQFVNIWGWKLQVSFDLAMRASLVRVCVLACGAMPGMSSEETQSQPDTWPVIFLQWGCSVQCLDSSEKSSVVVSVAVSRLWPILGNSLQISNHQTVA